jgi:hypothetical protein
MIQARGSTNDDALANTVRFIDLPVVRWMCNLQRDSSGMGADCVRVDRDCDRKGRLGITGYSLLVESNDLVLMVFGIDAMAIGNLAVADGEAH